MIEWHIKELQAHHAVAVADHSKQDEAMIALSAHARRLAVIMCRIYGADLDGNAYPRITAPPATAASVASTIPKDAPVTNATPKPPTWLDTNRVIDAKAAAALCGVTAQTWRRMYTSGRAPAPIRLSVRRIGWRISTLLEWLASKEKP